MPNAKTVDKKAIRRQARVELARRDLWWYCHVKAPDFYKKSRPFLKDLCRELQDFYEKDDHQALVINMPPRHGKSRSAGNLVEWALGRNHREKVMLGSYNETLSTTFSKNVRETITEQKADENRVVYTDVFPGVKIKRGDGAANLWSLEDGYNNYLATSPTGTATGFGATLLIIDDLIKTDAEANNEALLKKHWNWFTNTMLSRLEEGGKIIIIMTRWHSEDLAGRALAFFGEAGLKVRHVCYKAVQDDGSMLCPELLSHRSYIAKTKLSGADIVAANYQQDPIDIKGRLYSSFKTYDKLPADANGNLLFTEYKNYTDAADTGDDYLCSINYGVYNKEAYVLNVLYTKAPMEVTEPETAKMLIKDNIGLADIESNNGGRGFARAVERHLTAAGSNRCRVESFFQSKNKEARILSHATWVMDHIYFPANWRDRWPEYYDAMTRYQREGKNAHDDAPDATTGIAERISGGSRFSFG